MSKESETTRPEASGNAPGARVFVLRVWREPSSVAPAFRASVFEGGGDRRHFAGADALIEYLYHELVWPGSRGTVAVDGVALSETMGAETIGPDAPGPETAGEAPPL